MMTSWPASKVVPWMRWFCHHYISKRLFIERALIEALDQCDEIIEAHGVPEEIESRMGGAN